MTAIYTYFCFVFISSYILSAGKVYFLLPFMNLAVRVFLFLHFAFCRHFPFLAHRSSFFFFFICIFGYEQATLQSFISFHFSHQNSSIYLGCVTLWLDCPILFFLIFPLFLLRFPPVLFLFFCFLFIIYWKDIYTSFFLSITHSLERVHCEIGIVSWTKSVGLLM
jgi:hypothetical protein